MQLVTTVNFSLTANNDSRELKNRHTQKYASCAQMGRQGLILVYT